MWSKLILLSIFVAILSAMYLNYYQIVPSPIIKLKDGEVQGQVLLSRNGNEFYSFRGIPYSKPPVGERRFESPVPVEPWTEVLDATSYKPFCLQMEVFLLEFILGSEDCLYLNVFVPKNLENKPLPVMAYFHGGFFHIGSSELAGPAYFMDENVILVTINYRLGALGFLNTGDGLVRGNMGLRDQNLALRWVQSNIKQFGGDPSKVTIFGESAGGGSVHYHVLSPKSKGLFSRAIHQSGSGIHHWTLNRNGKAQFERFAKKVNCNVGTAKENLKCLKNLDGKSLVYGHKEKMDYFRPHISMYVPTIETVKDAEAFLVEEPMELLKSGRFNKVPLITGCNSHEGLMLSPVVAYKQATLNRSFEDWAPTAIQYPKSQTEVTSALKKFYFGDSISTLDKNQLIKGYTDMIGDRFFAIATSQVAKLESKHAPTYVYYYEHQGGFCLGNILAWSEGPFYTIINVAIGVVSYLFKTRILGLEVPHLGAGHADEVGLLFSGMSTEYLYFPKTDETMSKDLVKLWADFAKHKELNFRGISWPPISNVSSKRLRIHSKPALIDDPLEKRVLFWESLKISNN